MKTIRLFTTALLLLGFAEGIAQPAGLQAIPASGGVATGAGGKVTYSAGEVFYITASGAGGSAAAGVQAGRLESVLPVTLVRFTGKCSGSQVRLQWETASETDNDFFAVERSANARDWSLLTMVPGAGTTTSATSYAYTDLHPVSSAAYYRLKQVDRNGAFKYSPIVPVQNCGFIDPLFTLHPNPTTNGVYLTADEFTNTRVEIYDVQGNIVWQGRLQSRTTFLSLVAYRPATYLLKVIPADGAIKTFKLLKTAK
jgi:hypothetical protein